MTLSAHTNAIGFHKLEETLFESYTGLGGNPRFDQYPFRRESALSVKQAPVKSDHKSPTRYQRTVCRITEDRPLIWDYLGTKNYREWYPETRLIAHRSHGWVLNNKFKNINDLIQNERNRSNVRALNDLGGDKQQAFVDLAESRQTFQMLLNSSMTMYKALSAFRRGNLSGAAEALFGSRRDALLGKTVANRYLEYRYGWKPLLSSIYGYQEALKKDWKVSMTVKGKGFSPISFHQTETNGAVTTENTATGGCKTVYRGVIENIDLALANSLGMLNPASVAWELIPYSFVVDWFVPVGQVLEAFTATHGLKDVYGYSSTWLDRSFIYEEHHENEPRYKNVIQQPRIREQGYFFDRDVWNGAKTPEIFSESDPFGGKKASRGYAAAALIRGLAK